MRSTLNHREHLEMVRIVVTIPFYDVGNMLKCCHVRLKPMPQSQSARGRPNGDEPYIRLPWFVELYLHTSSSLGDIVEVGDLDGEVWFSIIQLVDCYDLVEGNTERDLRMHVLK